MKALKLLIAAATLAVSVSTTQAAVYSQNVVGYVNITIPAGKFQMIANQMDTGSNYLNNIFPTADSGNTYLLFFTNNAFLQYVWYNSGDSADGGQGWYNLLTDVPATNVLFNPGQGAFLHNSGVAPLTLTTLGSVSTGTNLSTIPTGFSMHSYSAPIGGQALDTNGFPATSSSDYMLRFNVAGNHYVQYVFYNSGDSADGNTGWYNLLTDAPIDGDPSAWPTAGESFFINHTVAPVTWTNVFVLP